MAEFDTHPGPLFAGDLIVVEVNGKMVPRADMKPGPQWFIVREDQKPGESVSLAMFNTPSKAHKARRICVEGMR